jgi:multiple sugar transport system substrate-binding protein
VRRALVTTLALSAAIVSCTAQPTADHKRCDLTIATGTDLSRGVRQEVLNTWNDDRDNEKRQACFVVIAGSTDEQHSEMRAAAQTGSGRFDVFNLDIQEIPGFASAGHLMPIDPSPKNDPDFFPEVWRAGQWDGTQYGVPLNSDAALLYYRSDLLGEVPPRNWQELRRDATRAKLHTPLAGQFASYEGLVVNALEIIRAHGGELADDHGDVLIDESAGVAGIQALIDAVRQAPLIPRHALEFDEDQALAEFEAENALFMRNWPYAHRVLAASKTKGLKVAKLPWDSVLGGQYLAVSKYGADHDGAQQLVRALTDAEQSAKLFRCGGFAPARMSAFEMPPPTTCKGEPDPGPELPDHVLRQAIEQAAPRPATPYYLEFSRTFQLALRELLLCHSTGELTECDTAGTFAEKVTPKLESALTGR